MFCLKPVDVWRCGTTVAKDGIISPRLYFSYKDALEYYLRSGLVIYQALDAVERSRMNLPCGKCDACLIRKRKDMSVRISNEITCHDECCFITLTYNPENVPVSTFDGVGRGLDDRYRRNWTLLPSDVQKFIKRLRRHLEYVPKKKYKGVRDHVTKPIRYYCVGEYGTKSRRPHYHILVFGWKPSDQFIHEIRDGYTLNRSPQMEKLWKYGFSTVADVNYGVARYCAQYVTKKLVSSNKNCKDPFVIPEFILQSTRNGGIGSLWLDKYKRNLRHGFINIWNGENISKCSIPRYYLQRLRKIDKDLWLELRDERFDFILSKRVKTDFAELRRVVEKDKLTILYQISKEQI